MKAAGEMRTFQIGPKVLCYLLTCQNIVFISIPITQGYRAKFNYTKIVEQNGDRLVLKKVFSIRCTQKQLNEFYDVAEYRPERPIQTPEMLSDGLLEIKATLAKLGF